MTDLIAAAETATTPYLIWIKVGLCALALVGSFGVGVYGGLRWDADKVTKLELADANFNTAAIQKAATIQARQITIVMPAMDVEATAQAKIVTASTHLAKEIPNVVPSTVACIPVGLVRVLNGAAKGSDSPDVSYAPGKSDDACAAVSWRSLAADLADDYATGTANAQQLNDLEDIITKLHDSYEATK